MWRKNDSSSDLEMRKRIEPKLGGASVICFRGYVKKGREISEVGRRGAEVGPDGAHDSAGDGAAQRRDRQCLH